MGSNWKLVRAIKTDAGPPKRKPGVVLAKFPMIGHLKGEQLTTHYPGRAMDTQLWG
jgi:hypothetical protein